MMSYEDRIKRGQEGLEKVRAALGVLTRRVLVLLVEDDSDDVMMVTRSIEEVGWECSVATSNATAIELLERRKFDLLLLDWLLLGETSLPVLQKAMTHKTLSIVLITGHSDQRPLDPALEIGSFYVITKPVTTEKLKDLVARATI